ncbi:MAG: pentapeptide repeat-containing protein [Planctomycetes bacterium]|nr:pentapeptide repeat-containing protein [Planctomycetota bacterium]
MAVAPTPGEDPRGTAPGSQTRTGSGRTARFGLAWGDVERPDGARGGDRLTIRWFTPRGRATRQELLDDLRFEEGAHLREIVAEVRREGVDEATVDLRGIDLRGEDLAGARLAGVDLSGARLDGCDLSQADLRGARLERAHLSGARLRGAKLQRARLRDADLSRADLGEAWLEEADLEHARLPGASLHRARIAGAALSRADLSGVDLSTAFRQPLPFVDPRPTVIRRRPVGAPPPTEPRRPTERLAAPTARLRPPPPPLRGRIIPHETVRMARGDVAAPHEDLDAAVSELLALRGKVERVTVVVDGVERVLFLGDEQPRVSVRVG